MIENFYDGYFSVCVFLCKCEVVQGVQVCGHACVRACVSAISNKGAVAVLQGARMCDSHSQTTGEERTAAQSLKY